MRAEDYVDIVQHNSDDTEHFYYSVPKSFVDLPILYRLYRHRSDGPAVIKPDVEQWWWRGEQIHCKDQTEFERRVKMIAYW